MKGVVVKSVSILLLLTLVLAACAQPTPEVVKEEVVVTQVVEKEVVVTEIVEVEKVVTPTSEPGRQTLIVAMAAAPVSLDPADYLQWTVASIYADDCS